MPVETSLTVAQHVTQAWLFLVAGIALFGGTVQMVLDQPEATAQLDNVHRFMAGVSRLVSIGKVGLPGPRRSGLAISFQSW